MARSNQHGIALFTTMVLLIIVTLTSVVLMRNAGFENKMAGAYADKWVAVGEINGAVDEVLDDARTGGDNPFVEDETDYPITNGLAASNHFSSVDNTVELVTTTVGCGRREEGDSQNVGLNCRWLTMSSNINFSRSGSGESVMATGITHPVLF